jgi:hypothetical protein
MLGRYRMLLEEDVERIFDDLINMAAFWDKLGVV